MRRKGKKGEHGTYQQRHIAEQTSIENGEHFVGYQHHSPELGGCCHSVSAFKVHMSKVIGIHLCLFNISLRCRSAGRVHRNVAESERPDCLYALSFRHPVYYSRKPDLPDNLSDPSKSQYYPSCTFQGRWMRKVIGALHTKWCSRTFATICPLPSSALAFHLLSCIVLHIANVLLDMSPPSQRYWFTLLSGHLKPR